MGIIALGNEHKVQGLFTTQTTCIPKAQTEESASCFGGGIKVDGKMDSFSQGGKEIVFY